MPRNLFPLPPTPLVPVQLEPSQAPIWCKLEYLNPSGSTKDRIARYILEKARRQGRIQPGDLVAEASSGSTSIAMAAACAQLGLRFIAVMPEGVSNERGMMIRGYGGEVRFSPKADGIRGAINEVERLSRECGAFMPQQFSNPDNAEAHRFGTARELLDQLPDGSVDAVVSGVGTGGTLVGLYRGLCEAGCAVVPVHARPVNLVSTPDVECCSFSSRIPGVADRISKIFNDAELPGLVTIDVNDEDAICTTRQLIQLGFPVGPSSGLNFVAAQIYQSRHPEKNLRVCTVFADRMERYFTTELFRPYSS
ncbi:MAG: cysteine synthase family protein [Gemmataceae bacterium]